MSDRAPIAAARDAVESSASLTSAFLRRRVCDLLDTGSAVRDLAVETGVVDADWFDRPLQRRPAFSPPLEVVRRFVERAVERHPSVLGYIGLRAVELLAWDAFWDRRDGLHPAQETTAHVVLVFTDLEDFTRFTSRVGDDEARDVLATHLGRCTPVVRRHAGRIVKRLGDGLMLAFADETGAVRAATELLATAPSPLRLRAGVHAGDAIVLADDFVGQTVNIAARVADAARGDQTLVTATTLDRITDRTGLAVSRRRHLRFKGVDGRVAVNVVTPTA